MLARNVHALKTVGRLLAVLVLACTFLGDFPAAEKAVTEAEKLAREIGSAEELALMLTTQAQMNYFAYGDIEKARRYLDEAVSLRATTQLQWATTMSIFGMARLAGVMGDLDAARSKFLESAEFAKRVGNKRLMYSCYSELAHVLRENGQIDEPLRLYRDLLPKWRDLGHRAAVAHELECISYLLAKQGRPGRAATLLAAADALRKRIDSTPTPMEQVEYQKELDSLREQVEGSDFAKAWDEGHRLSMDEAILLATRDE